MWNLCQFQNNILGGKTCQRFNASKCVEDPIENKGAISLPFKKADLKQYVVFFTTCESHYKSIISEP